MTEDDAFHWVENQSGLKILIGKDRKVTLTNGTTLEVTARGLLAAVMKAQKVLRVIQSTTRTETCMK